MGLQPARDRFRAPTTSCVGHRAAAAWCAPRALSEGRIGRRRGARTRARQSSPRARCGCGPGVRGPRGTAPHPPRASRMRSAIGARAARANASATMGTSAGLTGIQGSRGATSPLATRVSTSARRSPLKGRRVDVELVEQAIEGVAEGGVLREQLPDARAHGIKTEVLFRLRDRAAPARRRSRGRRLSSLTRTLRSSEESATRAVYRRRAGGRRGGVVAHAVVNEDVPLALIVRHADRHAAGAARRTGRLPEADARRRGHCPGSRRRRCRP